MKEKDTSSSSVRLNRGARQKSLGRGIMCRHCHAEIVEQIGPLDLIMCDVYR